MARKSTSELTEQHLASNYKNGGYGIAISSASAATAVLPAGLYRVCSTSNCWVVQGSAPTAVADDADCAYLAAGAIDFVAVHDPTDKLAVIRDSADGFLSIVECDE